MPKEGSMTWLELGGGAVLYVTYKGLSIVESQCARSTSASYLLNHMVKADTMRLIYN